MSAFEYTPENQARLQEILKRYPPDWKRSALLPALYLVQGQQGYITPDAMRYVAGELRITPADVEDVVSFYTMFYTRPTGKCILQVCRTLSCGLMGAERLTEAIKKHLHVGVGETTPDGAFMLVEVECLGACDVAPVLVVNDEFHERARPEDAPALLEDIRTRGLAAVSGCQWEERNRKRGA